MEESKGLIELLRTMGVHVIHPTYTYGFNTSVIHNARSTESSINRKYNSIFYHAVQESVCMIEMPTANMPLIINPSDICTEGILVGQKQEILVKLVMYDIY